MRNAMAMIELIFAIVIIAISVITIPTMMSIANQASKTAIIDDDVISRLSSQMIDKFQARWGGEYVLVDANGSYKDPIYISEINTSVDLNCSRVDGGAHFRINPESSAECNATQYPREIPSTVGIGANQADGNVSKGIEKLNGGTESLQVVSSSGEVLAIDATYNVRYVPSTLVSLNANTATATWRLGSSSNMAPDGSLGVAAADRTHLKRVVVRFQNNNLGVDSTLTFFKSNKGGN